MTVTVTWQTCIFRFFGDIPGVGSDWAKQTEGLDIQVTGLQVSRVTALALLLSGEVGVGGKRTVEQNGKTIRYRSPATGCAATGDGTLGSGRVQLIGRRP